jgi:HEAT repeat
MEIRDSEIARFLVWDSVEDHFDDIEKFVAGSQEGQVADLVGSLWDAGETDSICLAFDFLGVAVGQNEALIPMLLDFAQRISPNDPRTDVRWSVVHALGGLTSSAALPLVLLFWADTDADIRTQVVKARALPGADVDEIMPVLLAMSADEDPEVRDWATFILGQQTDADSPAIRAALLARLGDPESASNAAAEATVGLARRGDSRIVPVIHEALARPDVGNLYIEAARQFALPEFLPRLRELETNGWADEAMPALLHDAIAACATP